MPGWLKAVGKAAITVGTSAPYVGGIIEAFVPAKYKEAARGVITIADKMDEVGNVIISIEMLSGTLSQPIPGPEKLRAASVPVKAIMLSFLQAKGLKLDKDNIALFDAGCTNITQGFVDVLNACKED